MSEQIVIPIGELETRGFYELNSRNLLYGVYDGQRAFIGTRASWHGSRSLFRDGGPIESIKPVRKIATAPDDIELIIGYAGCEKCLDRTRWDPELRHWFHLSEREDHGVRPLWFNYKPMLEWIEENTP